MDFLKDPDRNPSVSRQQNNFIKVQDETPMLEKY